jgi:hypothetical protein
MDFAILNRPFYHAVPLAASRSSVFMTRTSQTSSRILPKKPWATGSRTTAIQVSLRSVLYCESALLCARQMHRSKVGEIQRGILPLGDTTQTVSRRHPSTSNS